jgi:hypothetical protein
MKEPLDVEDARWRYRYGLEPAQADRCVSCAHFDGMVGNITLRRWCRLLNIAVARPECSRCPLYAAEPGGAR